MQEAGHTFVIGGKRQIMHGTITLLAADNLASNALGGFKEGSTAHRGCRHCLATPAEFSSVFKEDSLELRTPSDHAAKCDNLEAASTARDRHELSVEYGINRRSILDELLYFKVCSGALVQDVMHDVLEGTHSRCLLLRWGFPEHLASHYHACMASSMQHIVHVRVFVVCWKHF